MDKVIVFNVVGTPSDVPSLVVDGRSEAWAGDITAEPGHAVFTLPSWVGAAGATVSYASGKQVRIITPPAPGRYEANLPPVRPPEATGDVVLDYGPSAPQGAFSPAGDGFLRGGQPWQMRGATEFRAGEMWLRDRGRLEAVVGQRKAAGANLVRIMPMKTDNTGWKLPPMSDGDVDAVLGWLGAQALAVLLTVFADTRYTMPNQNDQLAYWDRMRRVASAHPHVLLQLCNEWNHETQQINPMAFPKPTANLGCRGSGLTDAPPAMPIRGNPSAWDTSTRWDFACYHARRDHPSDARGITNYDPYEFIAIYPEPCPLVPLEGMKPEDYGFRTDVAALMGRHSRLGPGGVFHTGQGVNGEMWGGAEEACARAFYGM